MNKPIQGNELLVSSFTPNSRQYIMDSTHKPSNDATKVKETWYGLWSFSPNLIALRLNQAIHHKIVQEMIQPT